METSNTISNFQVLHENPRLISDLTNHLRKHEGIIPKIYLDPKGVPTIGIGLALGTVDKNGKVTVFPLEKINKILSVNGPNSRLTEKDYALMQKAVTTVNDSTTKRELETNIEKTKPILQGTFFELKSHQIDNLLKKHSAHGL